MKPAPPNTASALRLPEPDEDPLVFTKENTSKSGPRGSSRSVIIPKLTLTIKGSRFFEYVTLEKPMTCPPEGDCRGGLSLAHVRPRGRSRFDMTQPCSCRNRRRHLIPAEPEFRPVEPRPEKNHGCARGQRCRGALPAPLRSQAGAPRAWPIHLPRAVQHHRGGLAERHVQCRIAGSRTLAPLIPFRRLVSDRRQPSPALRRITNVEVPEPRNRRCPPQDGPHRWHYVPARSVR